LVVGSGALAQPGPGSTLPPQNPVPPPQKSIPPASADRQPPPPREEPRTPPAPPAAAPGQPCALPALPPAADDDGVDRFTWRSEYLLWWTRHGSSPALVTTGTPGSGGVLGQPGTRTLFGGGDALDYDPFNGFRLTAGYRLDRAGTWGVEASGFLLEQRSVLFSGRSNAAGSPVLGRPVVNARTGEETALTPALPTAFAGGIDAAASSRLWGAELNLTRTAGDSGDVKWGWLAGYRFLNLDEAVRVEHDTRLLEEGIAGFNGEILFQGAALHVGDKVDAVNQFHGAQVGARAEVCNGRWVTSVTGKVAMGFTHEVVNGFGTTELAGAPLPANAGLLVLPSNSGRFARDEFAVVPEVGVSVGYQVTPRLRAQVGYDFLYWSRVARAGDQVNRVVNPTQVPSSVEFGSLLGPAQPTVPFRQTGYWAQGINLGLEFKF
jgi:hypothetical protein